jgi:hypothetical protein
VIFSRKLGSTFGIILYRPTRSPAAGRIYCAGDYIFGRCNQRIDNLPHPPSTIIRKVQAATAVKDAGHVSGWSR